MTEKESRSAPVPSQRPRSPRVLSRGGATILLDADVAPGSIVKLTPPFGRELNAEVNGVWTDQIDGRPRIGVKLLDEDGWFAE